MQKPSPRRARSALTISPVRGKAVSREFAGVQVVHEILCGVYLIVATITGEMYVGSSVDIRRRWRQHRSLLRKGSNNCVRLQAAWDRHPERLSFAVLQECDERVLHEKEQEWFDRLRPALNSDPHAGGSLGRRMTVEQRERLKQRPQSTAQKHEFEGEMLTAEEIAQRTGLKIVTIYARLRAGILLSRPSQKGPAEAVDIGSEQLTPKQISERFDLPLTTVYSRLRLGWSGAALTQPRKHRARNSRG